jgi:hypothetical protein
VVFWVVEPFSVVVLCQHFVESWRWRQHGTRNVGTQPPHYTPQQPRKPRSLFSLPWKPKISYPKHHL